MLITKQKYRTLVMTSGGWSTVAVCVLCLLVFLLWAQGANARSLPDFTELVKDNSGAVVNISTTSKPSRRGSGYPGAPFDERQLEQLPEFFQEFFRGPQSPYGNSPGPVQPRQSMGSGFIVSKDGYVLLSLKGPTRLLCA